MRPPGAAESNLDRCRTRGAGWTTRNLLPVTDTVQGFFLALNVVNLIPEASNIASKIIIGK